MRKKISNTCIDLIVGILMFDLITAIFGGIIMSRIDRQVFPFVLGDILGGVIAIALALHLNHSVSISIQLDEKGADAYARKMAAIRYVIMAVAVCIALMFDSVFNPFGVLLGILALKFSAYLQPVTSKYITKKNIQ